MRHTIKKGKHDASEWAFGIHRGTRSEVWEVEFNNTNLYEPLDSEHDWNKLCGWSYGRHHTDSIRAGWRSAGGQIELCLYLYENGQRVVSKKTILVPINKELRVVLDYHYDMAWLVVRDKFGETFDKIALPYLAKPSWGYFLFPYFGGSNPSPQDQFINLKRV